LIVAKASKPRQERSNAPASKTYLSGADIAAHDKEMSAIRWIAQSIKTRRTTMLRKITLAAALAITAITMSVPASARPSDYPYASGYQDHAYGRNGAEW